MSYYPWQDFGKWCNQSVRIHRNIICYSNRHLIFSFRNIFIMIHCFRTEVFVSNPTFFRSVAMASEISFSIACSLAQEILTESLTPSFSRRYHLHLHLSIQLFLASLSLFAQNKSMILVSTLQYGKFLSNIEVASFSTSPKIFFLMDSVFMAWFIAFLTEISLNGVTSELISPTYLVFV